MDQRPVSVLLIDDDEDDFFLLKELLIEIRGKYSVEWASGFKEAISKSSQAKFDVFLLDYRLGAHTGLDVLNHLKSSGNQAPVIMLTGLSNDTVDRDAMNLGAADYLVKSKLDSQILDRTIRYAMERAQSMKALKEQEEKYRKIFEHSRDLMLFITDDGEIVEANSAATEMLGRQTSELAGHNLRDFLMPNAVAAILRSLYTGIDLAGYEMKLTNRAAEQVECLLSCWMHDAEKTIGICVIHDISQQRNNERQQLAIEKLGSNGRIARIIAHEVRNPLTNISLSVENILQDQKHEATADIGLYLDVIGRNAKRINHLISDLLNSTRYMEPDFSPHDVHELIENTLDLAMDRINLKNISVLRKFATNLCPIKVDLEKMKIALLNLMINAVESMKENEGVLSIVTEKRNGRCVINISDNGAGIPEEFLPRLFEPFFTRKPQGTGLGLTSTQNIILSHKGSINVRSIEGTGTTFTIALDMEDLSQTS